MTNTIIATKTELLGNQGAMVAGARVDSSMIFAGVVPLKPDLLLDSDPTNKCQGFQQ